MQMKHADLLLLSIASISSEQSLLPFSSAETSIFYAAGEFELSPTYFIDGLTNELWAFIWSFFVLFFIGLLISVKVYRRFFRIPAMAVADVAMYEMNFVTTQNHRLPTDQHEKFLSWRIQMVCQSVFNIVIACAFSAFILALLSVKSAEEPFHTIQDFATKRTHVICNFPHSVTEEYFIDSINGKKYIKEEFSGIYNDESCKKVWNAVEKDVALCNGKKKMAIVIPSAQFQEFVSNILQFALIFNLFVGRPMRHVRSFD